MDKTIFHGDVHPNTLKCPNYQSRRVIRFGQKPRVFKMLPVGRRQVELIVVDLRTGRVIHVGQGKAKEALKGFWRRLRRSRAKIQAVATDMASGYIAAVLQQLAQADLVLDHFHLVKWFNEKLSLWRRSSSTSLASKPSAKNERQSSTYSSNADTSTSPLPRPDISAAALDHGHRHGTRHSFARTGFNSM